MNKKLINLEGIIKLSLSLGLLIFATVVASMTDNIFIFLGMLFSTFGDIAIMSSRGVFKGQKTIFGFEYGIIAFAFAHLTYMMAMESENTKFLLIPVIIAILMIAIIVLRFGYKDYIWTNVCYGICIILNLINTLSFNWLATIGLAFFICSDLILAIKEKQKPIWQVPIWVTYVLAQILVITSQLIV